MSDVIRFGISADERLLQRFDALIAEKGYVNRSEAIRELIRETLTQESWKSGDGVQAAVLTFVVDTQKPEPLRRVLDCQQAMCSMVTATMHARFNAREEIWVLLLEGKSIDLRQLADEVLGIKGVSLGKLVVAGKAGE